VAVIPHWPLGPDGELDLGALPRDPGPQAARDRSPRTLSELIVASSLREVLPGLATVFLNDPFLALGGDSLSALALSSRLSALLGVAPDPSVILRSQGARELAQGLDSLLEDRGPDLFDVRQGGLPALVAYPGPLGTLISYRGLLAEHPNDLAFLALNPFLPARDKGALGGIPPGELVALMAGPHARALAERFPGGGFVLAGQGPKALFAWEAARQYEGLAGRRLACLLLLDPLSPGAPGDPSAWAEGYLGSLGHYEGFEPKGREGRQALAALELRAWGAYRPQPLSSPVLCLRPALPPPCQPGPPGSVPSPLKALARGPFQEESLQADHFSLILGKSAGAAYALLKAFAGI
jgi:hypothetical protein